MDFKNVCINESITVSISFEQNGDGLDISMGLNKNNKTKTSYNKK